MKCAQLAMALLAVAALPAWSMPPPIKHMGEKAQPGPVSQRIYPSPMEVSIARDGLVLVIRRAGPPGIEPGRFELALTSTVGPLSAVQCQIADREPHSVAVDGASASWQESGPSNAAVLVSATLRRADRVGLALPPAARTISATLPGGRAQNVLGAGLPGGLQFQQWYRAGSPAVQFRYTLVGPADALAQVDRVEYRLPPAHFAGGATVVGAPAAGFRLERSTAARNWSTTVVITLKDGSTSTVALPFAPPQ